MQVSAAMRMPGGGVFRVGSGQITDDSEMALCLAQALNCHQPGRLQAATATNYVEWMKSKPFDIGVLIDKPYKPVLLAHTCLLSLTRRPCHRHDHKDCTLCWSVCSTERREQLCHCLLHGHSFCYGKHNLIDLHSSSHA